MSKYNSISVKDAMNNIATNQYLLPAIQRKFVWEISQIEMLFDSILRNYPINSFMFWKITDNKIKQNYKFYTFIKDFAKKYHEDNPDAPSQLLNNDFYAVIDGQQRMTSLYVGLIGTYRVKKPYKYWNDNEDAMPTRKLYLEISEPLKSTIDNEKMYNFKFMTKDDLNEDKKLHPSHFWFKVGDVLAFKQLSDVNTFVIKNGLLSNDYAVSCLANLFNKINTEELINYYTVEEQDQDKVLDVFIRTNQGGTPLTFSDMLMSIASANWTKHDARVEIKSVRDEIYKFGSPNFDVSQDFVLKAILALSGVDVKFKIENFGRDNIALFESKWEDIKASLIATFELLEQLNFNDSLLRAKNAAIPIAYYIYKNKLSTSVVKTTYDSDDKKNISKWLSMTLLKGLFGGQSDSVLKDIREVISKTSGKFPIQEIFDKYKTDPDKNYIFNDDVITSFLEEEYGSTICGLVLDLVYPDVVLQHGRSVAEDHMHPKTMFEDKKKFDSLGLNEDDAKFYKKYYNTVLNLQLLEKLENESKLGTPLEDWVKEKSINKKDLYVKPTTKLGINDFKEFISDRKDELSKKLKSVLTN